MTDIKTYEQSGDQESITIQENIRSSIGMLPEAYKAMGRSGGFLSSMLSLDRTAGSNLDEKTRQLLSVAVSAVNGCGYCLHAHRALALKAGCSEEEISGSLEVAAMMSAYNTFNKAAGFEHDITPEALGIGS